MWCPKCKNEYREGITVCADCGCELVEDLSATDNQSDIGQDNIGIEDVSGAEETVVEDSGVDADDSNTDTDAPKPVPAAYVPKRAKYEDNKSSAFTFLLIGGVGIILVILHITGVINFNLSTFSKVLTNVVMGAMFVIFLIVGIISAKNCSRYKKEAAEEEAFTQQVCSSFHELYTSEGIDNACDINEDMTSYDLWNLRYHYIETSLSGEYPELADDYLEYITDKLYNEMYEEQPE